ncbi:MAG: hypothetical protein MZV65_15080 [Chromatiales bacterium]|nr:hypothetical protein [Chromatiales bacterium]
MGNRYGVGMVFLNHDPVLADAARAELRARTEETRSQGRRLARQCRSIQTPAATNRARRCRISSRCSSIAPADMLAGRDWNATCSWPAAAPTSASAPAIRSTTCCRCPGGSSPTRAW